MKYIIVMIMLLPACYASGQGVSLYNGVVSGTPDTVFSVRNHVYEIGGSSFLLGTYDKDNNAIYGVYLKSTKHFSMDSINNRNSLIDSVKSEFIIKYGEAGLDRSDGYFPFLPTGKTFTIYAWKNNQIIILLSISGNRDNTNSVKIEIYDEKML